MVERAKALGYAVLAITDECSLVGVVRAHVEAKELGLPLLIGSEFLVQATTPFRMAVLATNRNGYGNLSETITRLRMSADKGSYRLDWSDLWPGWLDDCLVLYVPDRRASDETLYAQASWFDHHFEGRAWTAVELIHGLDDAAWLARLRQLTHLTGLPPVAAGDVHMHVRSRKPLQDTMTATMRKQLRINIDACMEEVISQMADPRHDTDAEHRVLVAAIRAHNPAKAEQLMREPLRSVPCGCSAHADAVRSSRRACREARTSRLTIK